MEIAVPVRNDDAAFGLFFRCDALNDNAIMHSVASRLSELEIKGVAMYISALE